MGITYQFRTDEVDMFEKDEYKDINYEIFDSSLENPLVNQLIIGEELSSMQLSLVKKCLELGGSILSAEMGIGKTYIGVALAIIARCLYLDKKVIITAPTNVVKNFKELMDKASGELSMVCNGQADRVYTFKKVYNDINVFIVTQSFWLNNEDTLKFMYNHVEDFSYCFYDEADSKNAVGFDVYTEFSRLIPIKVVSNATPIDKGIDLVRNLLYAVGATNLDKKKFRRKYVDAKYLHNTLVSERVKVEDIYRDFSSNFINKNRADLGIYVDIDTKFHKMFINDIQRSWISRGMRNDLALYSPENKSVLDNLDNYKDCVYPEITKDNIPAFNEVLKILLNSQNEKVMIYARNISSIEKMSMILSMLGYNSYIINGQSSKNAKEISEKFNNDPRGITLTNIIKGINLDNTTKIILYGTPPDVMQTLYRAIRGREAKSITVDWIYYPEFEYSTLEDARNHISNIDVMTERDTVIINQLDEEMRSLKNYTFVPSNYGSSIEDKKNDTINGFVKQIYPTWGQIVDYED